MKYIFMLCCIVFNGVLGMGQSTPQTGDLNAGETSLGISVGMVIPSTGTGLAVGLGGTVGGHYFFSKELELYGNLGLSRIFKSGYRQTSFLMYMGGSYYPFEAPFRIGGEMGLNFIKEREWMSWYDYWTDSYYYEWWTYTPVTLYLSGVLGYEFILPFGRIAMDGRLGITYRGLFISGHVGLVLPLSNGEGD